MERVIMIMVLWNMKDIGVMIIGLDGEKYITVKVIC